MPTTHDKTALRIAKKQGATYNPGQGPDINTSRRAIEVAMRRNHRGRNAPAPGLSKAGVHRRQGSFGHQGRAESSRGDDRGCHGSKR